MTEPKPQGLLDMLQQASKKATEDKRRQLTQDDSPVEPEKDFNQLPMPNVQSIKDDCIIWNWDIDKLTTVTVVLYKEDTEAGFSKGDFEVCTTMTDSFSNEGAERVALALLSASQWHKHWKKHFGEFVEKEFMSE